MTEELATLRELVERLERAVGLLEGLGGAPAGRAPRGRRAAADVRAESRAREAEARDLRRRIDTWLERALPDLAQDTFAIAAALELAHRDGPVNTGTVRQRRAELMARAAAGPAPAAEEPGRA